jgi:hypothetical protein
MRPRSTMLAAVVASGCQPKPELPPPQYARLVRDGDAVFFVGNSFFDWQGRSLPAWVEALGRGVDPPIRLEVGGDIVPGEAPLSEFLDHDATRAALASGRYDVFVLQGMEFEPVDDRADFHDAVRRFHAAVTQAGARTALFMTWDFEFRPFIDELSASYDEIGRELGVPVIPAGLVFADCHRAPPGAERGHWLTADAEHPMGDLHQNALGTAANAYTTFAVLTGRDPGGVVIDVPGNPVDAAMSRELSARAWARASARVRLVGQ